MRATAAPGSQVVRLGSRVDATTVTQARSDLRAAIESAQDDVVVDLSAVELVDAAGLGMLVAAHRRAADSGRRLVLRDAPPSIVRVLALTRLHRVFYVESSHPDSVGVDAALASSGGTCA